MTLSHKGGNKVRALVHAETVYLVGNPPVPVEIPVPLEEHIPHFVAFARIVSGIVLTCGDQHNIRQPVVVQLLKGNGFQTLGRLGKLPGMLVIGLKLIGFKQDVPLAVRDQDRQSAVLLVHDRHQFPLRLAESLQHYRKTLPLYDLIARLFHLRQRFYRLKCLLISPVLLRQKRLALA